MAQTDYNYKSLDGVLGTQTQGGRMVGAEESAELWRHPIFLNEIGSLSFYKTCHWYVARSPYCERAPSSESQNGYVLDVSKSQRGGEFKLWVASKSQNHRPDVKHQYYHQRHPEKGWQQQLRNDLSSSFFHSLVRGMMLWVGNNERLNF